MSRMIEWCKRAKPADWIRLIKKLVPHVAIIISGMLIVFFLIDRVNKPMGFMTNEFHKRITFVLAILAIYFAIQLIRMQRLAERAEYRRKLAKAQEQQRQQPQSRQGAYPAPAPARRSVSSITRQSTSSSGYSRSGGSRETRRTWQ